MRRRFPHLEAKARALFEERAGSQHLNFHRHDLASVNRLANAVRVPWAPSARALGIELPVGLELPEQQPKPLRVLTLVVAALSLTMTSAHVLELPQKLDYSPSTYALVNGTLYRWFAIVGGVYTVAAIFAAWALAWTARRVPSAFGWASAGAALLSLAFVSWLALVMPVNRTVARAALAAPETVPSLWLALRLRWEYGHLTGFVLELLGFCALAVASVADAPRAAARPERSAARPSSASLGDRRPSVP